MKFTEYTEYFFDSVKKVNIKEIEEFIEALFQAFLDEKMIFIIGNGGSAANASHLAEDLSKGTNQDLKQTKRLRALSLTDNISWITAISNDDGYENIFEQQLKTFSKQGDLLLAISGSGNSKNIIKAIEWANRNDIITIGITGFNGGKLKEISKFSVHIPLDDMCSSESIHSIIFHFVVIELNKRISEYFKNN